MLKYRAEQRMFEMSNYYDQIKVKTKDKIYSDERIHLTIQIGAVHSEVKEFQNKTTVKFGYKH